jgi:D-lyxose ketol-isomerase
VALTRREYEQAREWAWNFVQRAGLPLREEEISGLDVADLGLGELQTTGLQILTLAATEWLGAKLLILQPDQFFPEHRHPPNPAEGYPGKTELLRGQYGEAFLYVPGDPTPRPLVSPPPHRRPWCTVWHEIPLAPGNQYVCPPNTWHWFQAGASGAVIWSISSKVTDTADQFSDPQVVRQTRIVEGSP